MCVCIVIRFRLSKAPVWKPRQNEGAGELLRDLEPTDHHDPPSCPNLWDRRTRFVTPRIRPASHPQLRGFPESWNQIDPLSSGKLPSRAYCAARFARFYDAMSHCTLFPSSHMR